MGTVALFAMGRPDGRRRGSRTLGLAVLVLLLVQPGLAVSAGFALSVLATAGIVLLAPAWRDALARWLPRWLAEAVAVPAAAQLACTPVVAALSGQVSLRGRRGQPARGAGGRARHRPRPRRRAGRTGPAPAGLLLGTLAGWCVAWIVLGRHPRRGATDGIGRVGDRCTRAGRAHRAGRRGHGAGPGAPAPAVDRPRVLRPVGRGALGVGADPGLATGRVGGRGLRCRPGGCARPAGRTAQRGGGRRRPGSDAGRPLPRRPRRRCRSAAGADPLPRRPRRRGAWVSSTAAGSARSTPRGCSTRPRRRRRRSTRRRTPPARPRCRRRTARPGRWAT